DPADNPAYCTPLLQLTRLAPEIPVTDAQYQRLRAEQDLLVDGAREDAPEGLSGELDEFERVAASTAQRVDAAGGVGRLSYADRVAITEAAAQAYYPLIDRYQAECPGADYSAALFLGCDSEVGPIAPTLDVANQGTEAIQVSAGDEQFTVEPDAYESRPVPASLRADDVVIAGIEGLVDEIPCDDPPAHCAPTRELIAHGSLLPDDATFADWSAEQLRLIKAVELVNRDGLTDIGMHLIEGQLAQLVEAVTAAGGTPAAVEPAEWQELTATYLGYLGATDALLGTCPPGPQTPAPSTPDTAPEPPAPPSGPSGPSAAGPASTDAPAAPLAPRFTG
ncbi:MAG: hypothetical protein KDB24_11915, partial [Microthrixaceae bacterium]|nr:hypothetical protein [Microthrixaceae bacterium]